MTDRMSVHSASGSVPVEDGFYWVRRRQNWQIAQWEHSSFWLCADQGEYEPEWFDEIDPRPITREPV